MKFTMILSFLCFAVSVFSADIGLIKKKLSAYRDNKLLPVWTSKRLLDTKNGGFNNTKAEDDKVKAQPKKDLLGQLRMLYTYAIAINKEKNPARRAALRKIVNRELKFIVDNYYDAENGGWFGRVIFKDKPERSIKRVLESVYIVYIFSEAYLLEPNPELLKWANVTFAYLNKHAWDKEFGGYYYSFDPTDVDDKKKNIAVNIHAMLALVPYIKATKSEVAKTYLKSIFDKLQAHAMYKPSGHFFLELNRDFSYKGKVEAEEALFGHGLETMWYSLKAAEVLGISKEKMMPWLKKGVAAAMKDTVMPSGAVLCIGFVDGKSSSREVPFWCPPEAMIVLIKMYRLTGDKKYLDRFNKVMNWAFANMPLPKNNLWGTVPDYQKPGVVRKTWDRWRGGLHMNRMIKEVLVELDRL
jgi:mannobiose 2-epimerase